MLLASIGHHQKLTKVLKNYGIFYVRKTKTTKQFLSILSIMMILNLWKKSQSNFSCGFSLLVIYNINNAILETEAATGGVLWEKVFLEISQNSNTCAWVSFLIKLQAEACKFIKKTVARVFSCELCKISKNTFLQITPQGDCFCWKSYKSWNHKNK